MLLTLLHSILIFAPTTCSIKLRRRQISSTSRKSSLSVIPMRQRTVLNRTQFRRSRIPALAPAPFVEPILSRDRDVPFPPRRPFLRHADPSSSLPLRDSHHFPLSRISTVEFPPLRQFSFTPSFPSSRPTLSQQGRSRKSAN